MGIDERTEELAREVELMGRCYQKGFKNLITGINTYVLLYVMSPDEREEYKPRALEALEKLEGKYKQIPFERLVPQSDFSPLFAIKYLLSIYSKHVRECFENPSEGLNKEINETSKEMALFSGLFRDKFKEKIKRLKQIPGYENFSIEFVDYDGRKWSINSALQLDS